MSTLWDLLNLWNISLAAAVIIFTTIALIYLTLPTKYSSFKTEEPTKDTLGSSKPTGQNVSQSLSPSISDRPATSVQIVVLGDIGRSPRMQYHAASLASHNCSVNIIGYTDTEPHPSIQNNPLITLTSIPPWPNSLQTSNKLLFLLLAPCKVLWQILHLYFALAYRTPPSKWMLVQNPPSIPTLAVAQLVCYLRNTRLVIDWHNFGYSILALRLGPTHPLVRLSEWYEGFFSRNAYAHFAVTRAMTRVLATKYSLSAVALHDRPAAIFQPLTPSQRASFLHHLPTTSPYTPSILAKKTRLLVSSTSWTPDEDFSILLSALVAYAASTLTTPTLPSLLAIITGRGPQRESYLSQISSLTRANKLPNIRIETAWLTAEDYASLLGAADLGVSLHTSSSGVDLPMKVVDMFGAGLPVAGWSAFEAWPELVSEGVNGRGFTSAEGLVRVLKEVFGEEGADAGRELVGLREGAVKEGKRRWQDEWDGVAGKVFGLL